MKRSYLQRKTSLKAIKGLVRRSKLRLVGVSDTSETKRSIQALLREGVILRDGGCILRHYSHTGACGGYRNDGELILQAEHLHTRSNSASFSDMRLVVCLCRRHHIQYKPQYPEEYYKTVKRHIGPERTALLVRVQEDRTPHKVDFKMEEIALKQQVEKMKNHYKMTSLLASESK